MGLVGDHRRQCELCGEAHYGEARSAPVIATPCIPCRTLGRGRWNGPRDARDGDVSRAAGGHAAIGLGDVHRVENPGPDELVFIEVQHGERLDENDIERIEDDYGRQ